MPRANVTTPVAGQRWTILSLIEWAAEYFSKQGFDEARLTVELLLAHLLGLPRIGLYTNYDRPLTQAELAAFKILIKRRLTHEPLQYIIGESEFMGLTLYVNRDVLIPRPETELLVEKVIEEMRRSGLRHPEVLDIGTGSGNIPIAIASFAPDAIIASLDVSGPAIETALRNIARHGTTNVTLHLADMFGSFLPGREFDIIVANPPYVSHEEFQSLQPEVRLFEPRLATTDEGDGLRCFRRICEIALVRLRPAGSLLMEVSYNQSQEVQRIVSGSGLLLSGVFNDYDGHERIIAARRA